MICAAYFEVSCHPPLANVMKTSQLLFSGGGGTASCEDARWVDDIDWYGIGLRPGAR